MLFRQIFDPKLAQYAYLIGCQVTKEAVVIDPERDIDQYIELAEQEGVNIVAVAETHIHADFLSGAREFAERLGTRLYLSDEGDENWKYEWIKGKKQDGTPYDYELMKDGDSFNVGNIKITAVHTPGHTPEHLAFLVTDGGAGATDPMGIVTGDFVFVGDVGRPDLLESAAKVAGMMEPSARRLYNSLQQFLELPEFMQIWPAHGAGSACGKALGAVPESTIGYEKRYNASLDAAARGEQAFVDFILEGQPEPPLYFARMKRDNKMGMPVLGSLPEPRKLTAQELRNIVDRKEGLIIDARIDRRSAMLRHIPGSYYAAFDKAFNTAVGSVVEDETTPLYLILDEKDVAGAVRDLVRIGYDNIVGYAEPRTFERYVAQGGPVESIDVIDFETVEQERRQEGVRVLDVRYLSEFRESHVPGALNASYTRMPEYLENVPENETLLVHCGSGARASVAASYLAAHGRTVKLINDEWARYAEIGEPEKAEPVAA